MSHACLGDAFAAHEAIYKGAVMADTWGHLAPYKNKGTDTVDAEH